MKNCPSKQTISDWAQGLLPEDQADAVMDHLDQCESCESVADEAGQLRGMTGLRESSSPSEETFVRDQTPDPEETAYSQDSDSDDGASTDESGFNASAFTPRASSPSGTEHGRYRIEGEIARGGMGAVLRGRDTDLERDLAIKVLLDRFKDNPNVVERFVAEAKIGGQLQHPGIAPVYELGRLADQKLFFAMKLVKGKTLSELLKLRAQVSSERSRFIGIFEQVCQTIAYAHSRGVLHRDLKPANIMVGAFGEVQVMDWGLAKVLPARDQKDQRVVLSPNDVDQNANEQSVIQTERSSDNGDQFSVSTRSGTETRMGSVIGTPAYMPPEQARGEIDRLDERADVFGLGAILCEILTGDPPYVGQSGSEVMAKAKNGDLGECLRRLDTCQAEQELIDLTKHCLQPDPSSRPRDATVLAGYVTEHLESVDTRLRESQMQRAAEAARAESDRKRRSTIAAAVLAIVLLGAGSWLYAERQASDRLQAEANSERQHAFELGVLAEKRDEQRKIAIAAETRAIEEADNALRNLDVAEKNAYSSDMLLASQSWAEANIDQLESLLDRYRDRDDLKGFEWHYWNHVADSALMTLSGHTDGVTQALYSPDGTRIASASLDTTVRIWDAVSGEMVRTIEPNDGAVIRIAFSPDGNQLASAGSNGQIKIWDMTTGGRLLTIDGPDDSDSGDSVAGNLVTGLSYMSDGERLFVARSGDVNFYSAATGEPVGSLPAHDRSIVDTAISPDGNWIATREKGRHRRARLWDAKTRERIWNINMSHAGNTVDFSADGDQVAFSGHERVLIVDRISGDTVMELAGHRDDVTRVSFSGKSDWIATSSLDRTVRIWRASNGWMARRLPGHKDAVLDVSFSPDATKLVSASQDGTVKVWDAEHRPESSFARGFGTAMNDIASAPDGKLLAGAGADKHLYVGDFETRLLKFRIAGHIAAVRGLSFDPSGTRIATASRDKTVRIWDADAGKELSTLIGHEDEVFSVCFHPDGKVLASAGADRTIRIWDAASGKTIHELRGHGGHVNCVAFSPDGKFLASASDDRTVQFWDASTGISLHKLVGHTQPVMHLCFSPSSLKIVSGSEDASARIWDVTSGIELVRFNGHRARVTHVAFTPDGRRVASASSDRSVKLWDTDMGQELLSLTFNRSARGVCFSLNGKRMIISIATNAGGVRFLDARTWTPALRTEGYARTYARTLAKRFKSLDKLQSKIRNDPSISDAVREKALDWLPLFRDEEMSANEHRGNNE